MPEIQHPFSTNHIFGPLTAYEIIKLVEVKRLAAIINKGLYAVFLGLALVMMMVVLVIVVVVLMLMMVVVVMMLAGLSFLLGGGSLLNLRTQVAEVATRSKSNICVPRISVSGTSQ